MFTAIVVVVVLIAVNYNTIVIMPAARLSNSGKWANDAQLLPVGAGLFLICQLHLNTFIMLKYQRLLIHLSCRQGGICVLLWGGLFLVVAFVRTRC